MNFCLHPFYGSVAEQCRSRPLRARTAETVHISNLRILKYQFLCDIDKLSISSNSEFLDTSKCSVCPASKCIAALIDDVRNHSHINMLVL